MPCTSDFGIAFQRGRGLELVAFADANYASEATDRRSVSGGATRCVGACECWFSRTQKYVTLSTTKAKYVAMADTTKEAIFMRYVWSFSGLWFTVYQDFRGQQGGDSVGEEYGVHLKLGAR